jgi:hypothetical protein
METEVAGIQSNCDGYNNSGNHTVNVNTAVMLT